MTKLKEGDWVHVNLSDSHTVHYKRHRFWDVPDQPLLTGKMVMLDMSNDKSNVNLIEFDDE